MRLLILGAGEYAWIVKELAQCTYDKIDFLDDNSDVALAKLDDCKRLVGKYDEYRYKVKKIYDNDVEYINSLLLNETRIGIAFRDAERILPSIRAFNQRTDTKQKLEELEREVTK